MHTPLSSLQSPLPSINSEHPITFTPAQWVEIDVASLLHNIQQIKHHMSGDKKIGIVIKSNAYGHGMTLIAQHLESCDLVDYLFVACVEDLITLRNVGITKKIIIISAIRDNIDLALQLNCSLMATDFDTLHKIDSFASRHNLIARVHIKIDTGLSRFGFLPEEIPHLMRLLTQFSNIMIEGVYTHCAESNNSDQTFTLQQKTIFEQCIATMRSAGFHIPLIHYENSAATIVHDDSVTTMIRIGAAAYGLWPSSYIQSLATNLSLRPILSWKSKIVHIKNIPAHSYIGYDRTHYTDTSMRIAIIPVGYYDGLDKRLSNNGCVKIKNHYAPIIGRISMNVTTIDVTLIPDVKLDDIVIIIGSDAQLSAETIAQLSGCNNPRQIVAAISPLIVRYPL